MGGISATDKTGFIDMLLNNKNNRLLSAVFIFLSSPFSSLPH